MGLRKGPGPLSYGVSKLGEPLYGEGLTGVFESTRDTEASPRLHDRQPRYALRLLSSHKIHEFSRAPDVDRGLPVPHVQLPRTSREIHLPQGQLGICPKELRINLLHWERRKRSCLLEESREPRRREWRPHASRHTQPLISRYQMIL